jgi:hypothetical protein
MSIPGDKLSNFIYHLSLSNETPTIIRIIKIITLRFDSKSARFINLSNYKYTF